MSFVEAWVHMHLRPDSHSVWNPNTMYQRLTTDPAVWPTQGINVRTTEKPDNLLVSNAHSWQRRMGSLDCIMVKMFYRMIKEEMIKWIVQRDEMSWSIHFIKMMSLYCGDSKNKHHAVESRDQSLIWKKKENTDLIHTLILKRLSKWLFIRKSFRLLIFWNTANIIKAANSILNEEHSVSMRWHAIKSAYSQLHWKDASVTQLFLFMQLLWSNSKQVVYDTKSGHVISDAHEKLNSKILCDETNKRLQLYTSS